MKTTKRNLLFAAVAAMVLGFAVSATAANGNLVQDSGGYYLIDDYADLKAFANKVNAGDTFISCKLTTDIVATDTAWTPIATNEYKSYNGSFEGQGHTITGLNNAGARDDLQFAGLVGVMGIAGVVRNVRVVGGNMALSTTCAYVGGLVGYLLKGTVENCIFSGSTTCSTWGSGQSSGGIVGYQTRGLVRNCHSTASLKGYHAGGIVGYMDEGTVATCCFNGYRPPDTNYQNFGAIAGEATQATLTHCYYDAQKAAPGVGQNDGSSDSTVAGLLTQYFTDPVCFAGFDFGNIWYMGDSGPMLRYLLEKYPYADPADGGEPVKTTACIPVTQNITTLRSDWYVVNSNVGVSDRIAVNGDANLILGDGCVLRAYGGIELTGTNRLTVWCQGGGSGTLIANGQGDDAAIGGHGYSSKAGSAQPGGALTVHGGTVTATARGAGAGIGGGGSVGVGDAGDGGTVRIYGGTVRAVSEGAGAGIGGGGFSGLGGRSGGKGGTVILNGGTVTAGSEDGGVAIGGGQRSGDDADGVICFVGHLGVVAAKWEDRLAGAQPVGCAERAAACHSNKWAKVSPCQQDHGSLAGPCPVCGRCPHVSYIDPADQANPEKTRTDCFGVFDETEILVSGWYAPAGNLTLAHRLVVDGDVNLILADGATITAEQGIQVAAGNSLAIWGQSGQSGELVAMNGGGDAAIGDGLGDSNAGSLAIDGFSVYANETAAKPVAAAQRESVCRSEWARLAPCKHADYDLQGFCLACGLGVCPVSYLDPTLPDLPMRTIPEYTLLTTQTTLATGWHVVRENAQIGERVEVVGDVNLILCDGVEMTAAQGFHVTGTNSLTVWVQSTAPATAGKLIVIGAGTNAAGIGGNDHETGGAITVNGGELTVSGGNYGAGIGGGYKGAGGTITINGGTVTAICGYQGAGIGGGSNGSGGTITINGGTVTATGGKEGAGIGGGSHASGGALTINGGTVTAKGGEWCAGIGGGVLGSGGTITINGGTVTASGGQYGAGIGGGRIGTGGTITINGGTVTANGGYQGAGIGGGSSGNGGPITINGGFVTATGGEAGAGIGGGAFGSCGTITVNGGTVTAVAGRRTQAIGHGFDNSNEGRLVLGGNMRVFASDAATEPVAAAQRVGVCRGGWARLAPCTEHRYDSQGLCLYCGKYIPYAGQTTLAGGFYEVDADRTVEGRIEVLGDVTLLLCDGAELTAALGFHVTGTNSLTICGQSTDRATAGKLTIPGPGDSMAGIGGNDGEPGGTVTVNGGVLAVTGGRKAGAIGGGRSGAGGVITVNGGFVTANGGELGTGLGGGMAKNENYIGGNAGSITINGGEVTATGGEHGAGIGGGGGSKATNGSSGGTVTINGGTVTATGGAAGAGIGAGRYAGGVAVVIAGGTVTAVAGNTAEAIGEGYGWSGVAGSLVLDGMKVYDSQARMEATPDEPVAPSLRASTCRSGWAGLKVCGAHDHAGGSPACVRCGGDAQSVPYVDPVGGTNAVCAAYMPYCGESTLASGWWTVSGTVTNGTRIEVTGDVHLILRDGAELTAAQGFHVTGVNSLTVWAQSGERATAGKLTVSEPDGCVAGIGGNDGEPGGMVTVNGGVLDITGGYKAGAIGGGRSGAGGVITINGGFVRASGAQFGTGLGGGMAINANYTGGNAGSITINGGEVTATGGEHGAGIGGGGGSNADNGSSGGTVAIHGGTVTATGGAAGAGIGAGRYAGGVAVVIAGGTVTAVAGDTAEAIGEGYGWNGVAGSIVLDGMKVYDSQARMEATPDEPVAPSLRASTCRSGWVGLKVCGAHDHAGGSPACVRCGGDAQPVPYMDPVGGTNAVCAAYMPYCGESTLVSGSWTVSGTVTNGTRIEVTGDVHLILCDGAELTAAKGFHVTGTNSLTVWAQSGERATAGKLTTPRQGSNVAGIGGNDREPGGMVTVNGGVLDVTSGTKSGAIGGGRGGSGGVITVNGGFVAATGGIWGTGLGGGMAANTNSIGGNAGMITINGGEVTATGGNGSPGIGGGGGTSESANNGSSGGTVHIAGGTVTATGGNRGAGIGGGRFAGGVAVTVCGGTVTASAGSSAQAIGEGYGWNGAAGSLVLDGMRVFASADATEPVAAAQRENTCRSGWAKVEVCPHEYGPEGVCLHCGLGIGPVSYLDPTDADSPGRVCTEYSAFTGQTELGNGWHVARGAVQAAGRVEVVGDVHLILCDGAELTAALGFHVTGTNSLTICGQSTDRATAGKLTVNGAPNRAAGIGGNDYETGGGIMVNGGVLTVIGGLYGAGIGGGEMGNGGKITVNGGFVTANGGGDGAGIGGGAQGDGGTITIAGGFVTAKGRSDGGAGIGGGFRGAGGQITITGGTVTSTGGFRGAGIGCGVGGNGGAITINGGTVTAVAGNNNRAIGHGSSGDNTGSLDIDGMRVFASADATEPVAAAQRVGVCRSGWAKLEVCPHGSDSGVCPWCGVVPAYAAWASTNNVAGAWNAKDAGGVHNVFRYAFDVPAGPIANPPLLSISFDVLGRAVIHTPPLVNGEGFTLSILATDDLVGSGAATYSLAPSGETVIPATNSPARFFRLKAEEE